MILHGKLIEDDRMITLHFNDQNLTAEDLHRAAQAISATGVTTFFPTLITASTERLIHQLKILKEAIGKDRRLSYAILHALCHMLG